MKHSEIGDDSSTNESPFEQDSFIFMSKSESKCSDGMNSFYPALELKKQSLFLTMNHKPKRNIKKLTLVKQAECIIILSGSE